DSYDYNTTYAVEVAVKTTGDYGSYSAPCQISTRAWTDLPIAIRQCGEVIAYRNSGINAYVIPNVSQYRFRFVNLNSNEESIITQTASFVSFGLLPSYVGGDAYSVQVAVRTTGDFGPYSAPCTITAPANTVAANLTANAATNFKVVASPNPFSDTFALSITEGASG